jgi:hypothetical protein
MSRFQRSKLQAKDAQHVLGNCPRVKALFNIDDFTPIFSKVVHLVS